MPKSAATSEARTDPRRRSGIVAIVVLALAWATIMQALGWAQTSYYSLTRALSHGTAQVDRYSWETRDASYSDGHYYSVKAPGLSVTTLPLYELLNSIGGKRLSKRMARSAHKSGAFRWYRAGVPSVGQYGNDLLRARRVRADIENYTPIVWMLGLLGTVIPALVMLLLIRSLAERLVPGAGTATASILGAGTLVMPFATLFFGHMLSALLGFACFAVLWRERDRQPNLRFIALAGLLAGLAVTTEYPLALVAVICGVYATYRGPVVRRGLSYAGGVAAGVVPLALYNTWAFGSPTRFSYHNAITKQGASGHDVLGLNDGGFFGIGVPNVHAMMDLLFSSKGLFVVSPVLVMALVGLVLMYKRGHRAESLLIGSIFCCYLTYNSGYWLPFGGGSPGPRFLFPVLPFMAVPLALAWKRFTATTLALAIPSILTMVAATITLPMIGNGDTGYWVHLIDLGNFEHTIASTFGMDNGWRALSPFLVLLVASLLLAIRATLPVTLSRDASFGALAVIAWGTLAALAPRVPEVQVGTGHDFLPLVLIAVAASLLLLVGGVLIERRLWSPRLASAPSDAG